MRTGLLPKDSSKPLNLRNIQIGMPTILRRSGFRFFFYSNEGNEPPHIHVEKGDGTAKYWLEPVSQVYSYGFTSAENRAIKKIVKEEREYFKIKWYEYFS